MGHDVSENLAQLVVVEVALFYALPTDAVSGVCEQVRFPLLHTFDELMLTPFEHSRQDVQLPSLQRKRRVKGQNEKKNKKKDQV